MGAVEPRPRDVAQHAGEATAPHVLLLLRRLRARTSLPLTALLLRSGNGRKGNDPCRKRGEDQFPHTNSPKKVRHPVY
jgi:hypothetical protein